MKRRPVFWILGMICFGWTFWVSPCVGKSTKHQLTVLATTFPVYQITRNIVQGRDTVKVELLVPPQLGCPHDYALTPQDMQKLSRADVLVINGLGMEAFVGAPLDKANSKIVVIDSSKGIKDILQYRQMQGPEQSSNNSIHQDRHGVAQRHHHEDDHGPSGAHLHSEGANPHLFASPKMAAVLAETIAHGLSKIDPGGEQAFTANAMAYAGRMNWLADQFTSLGKRLKNNRIVTQHGVFDYLARDMGLRVVAVVQAHAGQEPSAAQMLETVKTIKEENAGAIFTEPQYPEKIGNTIAIEAGIPSAALDPGATGPENAPLEYYEIIMQNNLKILENTLGTE